MRKLTPALSIYQKYEEKQNNLDDLSRLDMHFRIKSGADIVIEETGLHTRNPFKMSLKDLIDWSKDQNENLEIILNNYKEYYDIIKNRLDHESTLNYKPYFAVDGFNTRKFENLEDKIDYLKTRILELRKTDNSLAAYTEIRHRRANLFEIMYIQNGKNLENPIIKTYLDDLTFTNELTVLQSVWEQEPKDDGSPHTPYAHEQRIYSMGEVIEMTLDPKTSYRDKTSRPLVLPHTAGRRLVGDDLYADWNGLQIFDIDLKNSKYYQDRPEIDASEHRDIIFNKLKHYPWFVGVTLSSSRRALHIYTKVSRMHNLFDNREMNARIQKYWYRMSYIQKYAAIAYILKNYCDIQDVYTGREYINVNNRRATENIIDSAMARIGQGIAINYDPEGKWNSGFIDLYPCFLYHIPPVKGLEIEDWLMLPEVLQNFSQWFYEFKVNDEEDDSISVFRGTLNVVVDSNFELDGIKQIDIDSMARGDKFNIRWRVCNTIMYSFGDTDKAKELCHHILQSNKTGTVSQINSFIRTAVIHKKEADLGTIRLLKELGVKIGLDDETSEAISNEVLDKLEYDLINNDYIFYTDTPDYNIELKDNEYLGMVMPTVLDAIQDFKINIIESAPNTGKTEFFKALAKHEPVCLVIPFTSTIESKIVNDESINELFDVYYGDKSISEMKKGRSVVMTFDKFSTMPTSRYSMFKYIAIDESHLLFTSTYRLPVVSQTIENIRKFLLEESEHTKQALNTVMSFENVFNLFRVNNENTKTDVTKFILMSGTLTGELDYFKFYGLLNYIKVHKQHPFEKNLTIHICKTSETKEVLIVDKIVNKLREGNKIIHPTNRGDTYTKQIVRCVETILGRKIKYEYYKRANSDEEFMEDINSETTVDDIEILFCSDYLSVGIDIKDTDKFSVIFGNDFTGESIEQFNNRLRSTDIDSHVFFDVVDEEDMLKSNIINTNHIRYEYNNELQNMIVDEMNIANLQKTMKTQQQYFAILGELFSKYFVEDYSGKIKYIQSAFEIEQYELQYNVIARSLLYIKSAMVNKYNYDYKIIKHPEASAERLERFEILRRDAKREHDIMKSKSFTRLVDFLSSDDVYNITRSREVVYIKDNSKLEDGEDDLHLGFDENHLGGTFVITWHNSHKYSLEDAKSFVSNIRRLYSHSTINKIVSDNTRKSGIIEKIQLRRYMELMNLLFTDKSGNLSDSTKEILEIAYSYVDPDNTNSRIDRDEYELMRMNIRDSVIDNYKKITLSDILSERRQENINNYVNVFIDTIFNKRIGKDTVSLSYRRIYTFNSELIQTQIEQDRIYRMILLGDTTEVDPMDTENLSEMHIDDNDFEDTNSYTL